MNAPSKSQNRKKVRRTLAMLGKPVEHARETDAAAQTSRVSGPYFDANTNTYRVIIFDGGRRKSVGALKTMEEALAIKTDFERSIQDRGSAGRVRN
jgi:hypothetical protein